MNITDVGVRFPLEEWCPPSHLTGLNMHGNNHKIYFSQGIKALGLYLPCLASLDLIEKINLEKFHCDLRTRDDSCSYRNSSACYL